MTPQTPGSRQRGAILIVTLLFLVILTMLGVTAMTGTTMEERMAGNTRDSQLALQAAEAALREARRDINGHKGAGFGRAIPPEIADFGDADGLPGSCNTGNPGLCLPAKYPDDTAYGRSPGSILPAVPATHDLTDEPSIEYGQMTGNPPLGGTALARQPRYLMEAFCLQMRGESIGARQPCTFIRVTAAGYGRNPNTVVRLQEIFVRE